VSPKKAQTGSRSGTAYEWNKLTETSRPPLKVLLNLNLAFICLSFSDPMVNRYRVQWSPEFCSHNGSRTQEKLITQVTNQECVFHPPYRCEATF